MEGVWWSMMTLHGSGWELASWCVGVYTLVGRLLASAGFISKVMKRRAHVVYFFFLSIKADECYHVLSLYSERAIIAIMKQT
jgi:hypothetical protein